jgi:hypothetical protein
LVVAEGHGWFLRRYDRQRAVQFFAIVDTLPNLTIRGFDVSDLGKASRAARKFQNPKLTVADAP